MNNKDTSAALTVLLGVLIALSALGTDLYVPALPDVSQSLSASVSAVQLTLTTYFIGLACGQLLWGPLSDRYGRKPILLFGLLARPARQRAGRATAGAHDRRVQHRADRRAAGRRAPGLVVGLGGGVLGHGLPSTAGAASSLLGAIGFFAGAIISTALGAVFDGTSRPMATVAAVAGLGAYLCERTLVRGKA